MRFKVALTLVEVLVVVVISSIVILVLMEALLGGLKSYRHGIAREDMLQNARNVLDRMRLEIVNGAVSLEIVSDPRFVNDENHNVLKLYLENGDSILIGCYRGNRLPDGENVYILGMLKGGGTLQPLTDGYDGGRDSYWVSIEEFKVELFPGKNSFIYATGSFANNGVFIYLKIAGPSGLEAKKLKKSKLLEVSTVVYLRR